MLTPDPTAKLPDLARDLANRLYHRQAKVAVIGLGYVGLPLAMATARAGFSTTGFDIDEAKPEQLNAGKSYIGAVTSEDLLRQVREGRFRATSQLQQPRRCRRYRDLCPHPSHPASRTGSQLRD